MIGVANIGCYVPVARVNNLNRATEAGKTAEFIQEKTGFVSVARMSPGEDTSDLCVKAYEALTSKQELDKKEIDVVVVCTQNPDQKGLPHTSAIVHAKLGLDENVAAFDISLGCSGYVYALSVVLSFMQANGLKKGLLFTADPYSKVLDNQDYDTELLFGDAATCTLLSDQPKFELLNSCFSSNGALSHSIQVAGPEGKLSMLGSNVFKFAIASVPKQVDLCLERNGLSKDEIDVYLMHQGSKFIIDNLVKKMGVPAEKMPFKAAAVGNTVSSTLPLMLEEYLPTSEKLILLSGFGVGLSWATTILKRI